MLTISFITTNKHKFAEVSDLLKNYPLKLKHLSLSYAENHDSSLEDIASTAAKTLAQDLKCPVVLEDSGLFFDAYPGFPGALPKFIFQTLGYEGIFKLLVGESRKAYFKTVAAFCEPKNDPKLFTGLMRGIITDKIYDTEKDVMPYDRIFIPEGQTETISRMSLSAKNSFSQRAAAFRQFGDYIVSSFSSVNTE